jgi:transposase
VRRCWAKVGRRPVSVVRPRYEWCYLYGFVHPRSGRSFWLLLPTVRTDVFSLVLAEFAQELGLSAERRVVLVLDGAGWHTSRKVVVPEGIDLVWLPAYSPELQPAERLWVMTDEAVANRCFEDLESLMTRQAEHCRRLAARPERLRGPCCYHWWPEDPA